MTPKPPPVPVHRQVHDALRDQILFGELAPGAAVTIQGIADDLGAGMTPVREALRRLVAEGALEMQGNRRVCVPELSPSDIDEIALVRRTIEPELVRRAVARIQPEDVDALGRADEALDRALVAGDVAGYLRGNHRFHTAIYQRAQAPILASLAEGLWLRFGPSMRVVCSGLGVADLPDQHKAMMDALQQGDAAAAAAAMALDVEQGMTQLRLGLGAGGTGDSAAH